MAAQNLASSAASARPSSTAADRASRTKRARTKHACDECRRSQKKCDGDKPCRRCYLNGTQCTYTPHKSRNHCACTGQGAEDSRREVIPDIFIFPNAPGSFHTWSTTSSPEQSPTTSGLDTPSPTHLSHDEMLISATSSSSHPGQHSAITHVAQPTAGQFAPAAQQQPQIQAQLQRNHLYTQRSYSVPNVSTTHTPIPHPPFISPPVVSTSLPQYSFEPSPSGETFFNSISSQDLARQQYDSSPSSLYNELLPSHLAQETGMTNVYDSTPTYTPPASNANVDLTQPSFSLYNVDGIPTGPYDGAVPLQNSQLVTHHNQHLMDSTYAEDSFSAPSTALQVGPAMFASSLLLDGGATQMQQVNHPEMPYGETLPNPYGVGSIPFHSSISFEHSPQQLNFAHSHTPSPVPPSTPTDLVHHSYPLAHVDDSQPRRYSPVSTDYGNDLAVAPSASVLMRWPSPSHATPQLETHRHQGNSVLPSSTSYSSFEYFDGQWAQ